LLAIVNLVPSKPIWVAAIATAVASIPLAMMFAKVEWSAAIVKAPLELSALVIIGVALAFVGASLASRLNLARMRTESRGAKLLVAAVGGLLFGLLAAGVGVLVAEFTPWALLLWFLLGSFAVAAQSLILSSRKHDG
jgi:hypothetical protein